MAKRKGTRPRRRRRLIDVLGPPTDRALMLRLVVELNHITRDLCQELGVTDQEQDEAYAASRRDRSRARPAEALMAALTGAGDVLNMWRRDKRYLTPEGGPRIIPVRGRGATLESLVRQCVPQVPFKDVLGYFLTHSDVTRLPGNKKVELRGSSAVIAQRTPEMVLAFTLTQFRHMADTAMTNAVLPPIAKGAGLFQRQIEGFMTPDDFERYAQAVKPKLQEFCDHLEDDLTAADRPKRRGKLQGCGVGIFVYRKKTKRRSQR